MMMGMLRAGGMPLLVDMHRPADASNIFGYFEYAPVKASKRSVDWVTSAPGKAVKVVSPLVQYLPDGYMYEVIFMERPLQDVMQSQRLMMEREGKPVNLEAEHALEQYYAQHLQQVGQWLNAQANIRVLPISFHETLEHPAATARAIDDFLGMHLCAEAMSRTVSSA